MYSIAKTFAFDEMVISFKRVRRGKLTYNNVLEFETRLLTNLTNLSKDAIHGRYKPGGDNRFYVYEPKKRKITSNPFQDKIIQDVLCRKVLEPIISPRLIYDNYASQPDKGTTMGVKRLISFLHSYYNTYHTNEGYVYQFDIKKYFDSIRIDVLHEMIDEFPLDSGLKKLLKIEVRPADKGRDAGICIGHQCSQWLAVYYLNRMDHRIKEELQMKRYGRYMDDFLMIHPDKEVLRKGYDIVVEETQKVGLRLNEKKSQMYALKNGIKFLGFHFYLTKTGKVIVKLKKSSVKRVKKRLRKFKDILYMGNCTMQEIYDSYNSWRSFAINGSTEKLVYDMDKMFYELFWHDMMEAGIDFTDKCYIPGRLAGKKNKNKKPVKAKDLEWAKERYSRHGEHDKQYRDEDGFLVLIPRAKKDIA